VLARPRWKTSHFRAAERWRQNHPSEFPEEFLAEVAAELGIDFEVELDI
jgi:hypothetical protein